ncbi:hypothetical protein F5Y16DRAFT_42261 [Xylariaceae sp. FL0255]|nr:hypothetical protein F5Y16DRAFT_42261 [Xylariaceae sp. FL0255]
MLGSQGSHRDNAHFDRARWRKRIILPCWAVQAAILVSLLGIFSYRLSHTVETWEEEDQKGNIPVVEFAWEVTNVAFSLLSLIITLVSIARFIAEVLTPLPLLFGSILNLVLSIVTLALDIVIYTERADSNYSLVGLGLDIGLIRIFTIIPLIYSIIIYRRFLTYDDYHLPGNHKAFGYGADDGFDERESMYREAPTPYDPTNANLGVMTTITSDNNANRSRARSLSTGRRISLSLSRNASPQPSPSPSRSPSLNDRRVSYDHKRDTQFEDYVARRTSVRESSHSRDSIGGDSLSLHDDARSAMGAEFGWSDLPTPTENMHTGQGHMSRSRVSQLGHQQSYEGLIQGGGMGSPDLTITVTTPAEDTPTQYGHSLISVPESHEEEDYRPPSRKRSASAAQLAGQHYPKQGMGVARSGTVGTRSTHGRTPSNSRPLEKVAGLEDIALEERKPAGASKKETDDYS